jgi:hypothetical protein
MSKLSRSNLASRVRQLPLTENPFEVYLDEGIDRLRVLPIA